MAETAPAWLMEEVRRAKRGDGPSLIQKTRHILANLELATVCESALCPNRGECYSHSTATFLILGETCTRRCAFCAVAHQQAPPPPKADEAERLAAAVAGLHLTHVVITSVTRDDLSDGGAAHFAQVVATLRSRCPEVTIELLVPDFQGDEAALMMVLAAQPDILAHNIETVPGLYDSVRSGADYARSLQLLRNAKRLRPGTFTKSGVMLGLGEQADEIEAMLHALAATECDVLTIGQYLAPSLAHAPVRRYLSTGEFAQWRDQALGIGFKQVVAGPLVRSSYHAAEVFNQLP